MTIAFGGRSRYAGVTRMHLFLALVVLLGCGVFSVRAEDVIHSEENLADEGKLPVQAQLALAVVLIALSAVFAGLTIGIMGLDTLTLEIIADSGAEPDKTYAKQLLPVRKKGHWTLCTLVLGNMWANVMIAQFCADVNPEGGAGDEEGASGASGIVGFVLSTLLILIFAEILPMSICKSSQALKIAAAGVPILKVFMIVLFPVAWPLGKFLDSILHHDIGQIYDRNELKRLMVMHCETHGDKSGLMTSELQLLIGAMEFHEAVVGDIMTPLEQVFMLKASDVITADLIEMLWRVGHSRVPVYDGTRDRIIGIILVKDLILSTVTKGLTARDIVLRMHHPVYTVNYNVTLPAMLKNFQQGHAHLVIVQSETAGVAQAGESDASGTGERTPTSPRELEVSGSTLFTTSFRERPAGGAVFASVGVVTLEDLIEKLIRDKIFDEYDDDAERDIDEDDSGALSHHAASASADDNPQLVLTRSSTTNSVAAAGAAKRKNNHPLVNFYSYFVRPERTPLTTEQWIAAAQYLCNTREVFVHWKPRNLARLLRDCGDIELQPPPESTASRRTPSVKVSVSASGALTAITDAAMTSAHSSNGAAAHEVNMSVKSNSANAPALLGRRGRVGSLHVSTKDVDDRFVLYRAGVKSNVFTLVLSGCVEVHVGSEGFVGEKRTFSTLGEAALTSTSDYIPDYTAYVRGPTRIVRVSREAYEAAYNKVGGSPNAHMPRVHSASATSFASPTSATRTPIGQGESLAERMKREDTRHNDEGDDLLPGHRRDATKASKQSVQY